MSDARPEAQTCRTCGTSDWACFYETCDVPVHSVRLVHDQAEARRVPKGDVRLGLCRGCGLIANLAFDAAALDYSGGYEGTQAYSETFGAFHEHLGRDLVERYDLRGRDVVEVGCGRGEFLALLCDLGVRRGVGFDPAYPPDAPDRAGAARFVRRAVENASALPPADLVCCKMTLEHLSEPQGMLEASRRALALRPGARLFVQVPEAGRILREAAFWDVYYEHCSYFLAESLGALLASCGLEPLETWTGYDGQYLMATARPGPAAPRALNPVRLAELEEVVAGFAAAAASGRDTWRRRLAQGPPAVVWGAGSKAVAFLAGLADATSAVERAVDVNPHKQGTFLPGSGLAIVSPEALRDAPPKRVVVMNPVYAAEIRAALAGLGLSPELLVVR